MPDKAQILIIGAGEAGVAAASALREGGHKGKIILVNEEACTPYERPPLSKEMLTVPDAGLKLIRRPEWYAENDIDLLSSTRVLSIDADRKIARLADGDQKAIVYDKLMFATGARPRRLSDFGDDVIYLRTHNDSLALRNRLVEVENVVVIGGGVIGLEVASSARSLGKHVTVMDTADRLMGRVLAPCISSLLQTLHETHGTEILFGAGQLTREGDSILLENGRRFQADLIVAGIGVLPNDELARQAGCRIDNGIVVDQCGRTSVQDIYAAGDVAALHHPAYDRMMRIETWQHASRHGGHVGRTMMGFDDGYRQIPWFWTDQFGVNLQMAGSADGADQTVWRGGPECGTAFHFAGTRLIGVTTINNGRDMRPAIQLIESGWRGDCRELVDESIALPKLIKQILRTMQR